MVLSAGNGERDREYWINVLSRIARPVLTNLAEDKLRKEIPIHSENNDRKSYAPLEALGRLACGMAPWIESGMDTGKEGELRKHYAELIRNGITVATDTASADYMNFEAGRQSLVDAAFLAQALTRSPNELYKKLPESTKRNLIRELKKTRAIKPVFNNWLLFSAMIEAALYMAEEDWDSVRVDYALKKHEDWYAGDGLYNDGNEFHMDYYNSFVIHPMMVDILALLGPLFTDWTNQQKRVEVRARRYAVIQERTISPEGTFPLTGRSITYRFAVFHLLAQMALYQKLEKSIHPAQVRSALTAVIRRIIEARETFDENGWLQIGLCGSQPRLGEHYITTGSLYICSTVFLPLGLPVNDIFWQGEAEWTTKKAWAGKHIPIDHALVEY
ncbi:DUF2264 domain-containing protein [Alteribacillus sp. HJP-4]|uniref:DUF2264 domain-containing protein n=1 Tax=Alteribacillus sp. HJP-4 TaxID=2775394 RepID=UPI0035CD0273